MEKMLVSHNQLVSLIKEQISRYNDVVLMVKKYLDTHYVPGKMPVQGNDFESFKPVVMIVNTSGVATKTISARYLFYKVQNEFKNITADIRERDILLRKIIIAWYYGRITPEGFILNS